MGRYLSSTNFLFSRYGEDFLPSYNLEKWSWKIFRCNDLPGLIHNDKSFFK